MRTYLGPHFDGKLAVSLPKENRPCQVGESATTARICGGVVAPIEDDDLSGGVEGAWHWMLPSLVVASGKVKSWKRLLIWLDALRDTVKGIPIYELQIRQCKAMNFRAWCVQNNEVGPIHFYTRHKKVASFKNNINYNGMLLMMITHITFLSGSLTSELIWDKMWWTVQINSNDFVYNLLQLRQCIVSTTCYTCLAP